MPWLNVPEEGRTVFIKPPLPRGGGLLGGSSGPPKMSKLQALAAARKKKREEQKTETPEEGTTKSAAPETSQNPSPAPPLAPSDPKTQTLQTKVSHMNICHSLAPSNPKTETSQTKVSYRDIGHQETPPALDGTADSQDRAPAVEKAQPSTFAQALLRSASETPQPHQQLYAPPWLAFTTDEALIEAFSKPSPDDVVQAAQSQGSRFARK